MLIDNNIRLNLTLMILATEVMIIIILNKYLIRRNTMLLFCATSFIIFLLGLYIKRIDFLIDYRFFLIPFIGIGILSIYQIVFKTFFNIPFYINMQGFEFPENLKSNKSGFTEFTSGLLSISLVIILIIVFFFL